jgi:hypothetical protein
MLLTNKHIGKMSEASIAQQYSIYLQQVLITEIENGVNLSMPLDQQNVLSYEEFKDYFILALVGKDNYVDTLVRKMQHQKLSENA